ncbi:Crp/Fnr family transcriptional regulator [Algoriphagus taiwanensis]|uniref:Crp/Fnr family transcriptional regulator n=1 Tax=Algoriphagus taiwanensis TaxID=1445656 RepID=A0ABQ6Q2R6_9BACT|nr:Crp/Fnr family transcriptional regulator [Algoriphagus taiwanensis]
MPKTNPGAFDQLFAYFSKTAPISRPEFEQLIPYFEPVFFPKYSYLLRQGEICNSIYFVSQGSFRIYHIHENGQELTRYFAFANKFGTNLTSMIEGSPSVENLQAIEPLDVLEVKKQVFFELVERIPQVNKIYLNILQNAYITSQKRIYDLQGMPALDRLRWLLEQYPLILSRIPSRMIASYLGITPYTLSRLKSEI